MSTLNTCNNSNIHSYIFVLGDGLFDTFSGSVDLLLYQWLGVVQSPCVILLQAGPRCIVQPPGLLLEAVSMVQKQPCVASYDCLGHYTCYVSRHLLVSMTTDRGDSLYLVTVPSRLRSGVHTR